VACDVLRRQRLWEVFLYQHLKIEWAKIYELGCSLEHATAPEVTEALADFLGHPKICPRGNPIPAADGSYTPLNGVSLNEVAVGKTVLVLAIRATATDVLKHLQDHDILPGRTMTLLEAAPMQGPITLDVNGHRVALGLLVSELIIVEIV
jgi:DtxR family Mn-dependent transcriptional regulator